MKIKEISNEQYDELFAFWKENYIVNEMDSIDRLKVFLEKNPNLSLCVEDNGEIVGTILGSFDGRRGYIQKVVVKKEIREKGIGKQLINKVLKKMKVLGVTFIQTETNQDTKLFYEKCGFNETNVIPMNISFPNDKSYEEFSKNLK